MKKLLLAAALIGALTVSWGTPATAAEYGNGGETELWCGTSPEMQEEFYSALLQRRFMEQMGIAPYIGMGPDQTPSVGEARLLVLPIAFSDSVPLTDSWETDQEYYEELYFGPDNGGSIEEQSVQAWFSRQSYGRLSVTGDVLKTYHDSGITADYDSVYPKAFYEVVTEALAAQDIDYERYDADNDGFVDCLVLAVRANTNRPHGYGIFSYNWAADYETGIEIKSDKIKVRNHVCILGDDNRTPIHELLHCMGLLDNYKIGDGGGQSIIPRIHDEVMSSGYHVNSFYKYLLGWVDPVIITDNSPIQEVKLFSIEKDGAEEEPKAALYIPDAGELPFSEFYIAEYRNGENYEGSKNEQLRASQPGITLWHCNGALDSYGLFEYRESYIQAVCPSGIEDSQNFSNADRFVPSGLPWSEYSTSNAISPDTPVNSDFHDGVKTNFYMKVVDMNDEYATLKIGSADTGGHTHSYSDEWTADTVSHWHECECGYETVSVAHTPVEDAAVEPTCTAPGKTAGSHCSVCGYVLEAQEEVPATGHSYSDRWWSDGNNHWHACSRCLKELKDIAPHIEDEGVVIREPTVTSRGVKRFSCTICGYRMRTEYIPKLEPHTHEYSTDWKSDGDHHWHECECGERTDEAGHTAEADTAVEPTCTTPGKTEGSHCPVCGYVLKAQREIPAKGHSYAGGWSQDDSNHWRECSECGEKADVAAHTEDKGTVTKRPTEEETGVKTFCCSVCGRKLREESIDKLEPSHEHSYSADWKSNEINHWHECECGDKADETAHSPVEDAAVEPTCTTPGKTAGSHCSVCGYVIEAQREIPAKGHSYAGGWSQDDSNHWRECSECGDKTEIAAHTEDKGTVTKRPTEEETGVRTFCCSVCGYKLREETIDKLPPVHIHEFSTDWESDEDSHWHECECEERAEVAPHLWDDGEVTKAPTSTEEGTRTYTCTVCARTRTESIPATGGSSGGGGGGSFSGETTYQISVPSKFKGGVVKADARRAAKGETVQLNIEAVDGYLLETLTVKDRKGNALSLTRGGGDSYTFIMPASKVTVEAAFAPKPVETEKPQEPKPVETERPTEPEKPVLPFADVKENTWYYDAVAEAYRRGLMTGISETQFEPEAPASRGMMVTILYRMEGEPVTGDNGFTDVSEDSYYAEAVAWAVEKGIVKGRGDGTFHPDDPITREELATFLYRYASCKGRDMTQRAELSGYVDAEQVSGYAYEPLSWAKAVGLISGTDWGGLHPGGRATRAEIAAVFLRYYGG